MAKDYDPGFTGSHDGDQEPPGGQDDAEADQGDSDLTTKPRIRVGSGGGIVADDEDQ